MVVNAQSNVELHAASRVFTVGCTAGFQVMIVVFELFGRVMFETEIVSWVVRDDVPVVRDSVGTRSKRGDKLRKGRVTNTRLAEVDHGGFDASMD